MEKTNTNIPPTSKYDTIKDLSDAEFKRLTGVKRTTFALMAEDLMEVEIANHAFGGRPNKLTVEDRLLMALEYLREYRTYFHVAQSYGVSEANAYKVCRWVEDTLIHDKRFALPGRKELLKSDAEYEVVLVDASESPIERPKKDSGDTTPAKRSGTRSKAK
jgi:Helix-turn-helix of DDE superfamily endonuclease